MHRRRIRLRSFILQSAHTGWYMSADLSQAGRPAKLHLADMLSKCTCCCRCLSDILLVSFCFDPRCPCQLAPLTQSIRGLFKRTRSTCCSPSCACALCVCFLFCSSPLYCWHCVPDGVLDWYCVKQLLFTSHFSLFPSSACYSGLLLTPSC